MTTKTTYLLGIFAVIVLGTLLYINLCSACMMPQNNMDVSRKESVSTMAMAQKSIHTFSIKNGDFVIEVNDNFNFNVSTPSFLMPISVKLKSGITDLKDYLDAHPEKEINITGYYNDSEENTSPFPNLGVARAHSVKNHFVVFGISSDRINTEGKLMEDMTPYEDIFLGPVSFDVSEKDINEQEP